jgi:hypothetical protein
MTQKASDATQTETSPIAIVFRAAVGIKLASAKPGTTATNAHATPAGATPAARPTANAMDITSATRGVRMAAVRSSNFGAGMSTRVEEVRESIPVETSEPSIR